MMEREPVRGQDRPAEEYATVASRPPARWWRGLTGTLAAGLAVLALIVVGVQIFAFANDAPGAEVLFIGGHVVAGVAALVAQRLADRRRGLVAGLAGTFVGLLTAAVLWFFWFA
ncbi:hypothetical protein CFN78_03090 [Amycolatopsis antarctica]|uniref:Uncharacterized protein n=2 Tax=Amycolatopsis antarctica TaxID=1854586 RepID=A0A263D9G1_9PSEU|nr:hypothetical protein CFN78_03090 [Amycolatopsis antarctica]